MVLLLLHGCEYKADPQGVLTLSLLVLAGTA